MKVYADAAANISKSHATEQVTDMKIMELQALPANYMSKFMHSSKY